MDKPLISKIRCHSPNLKSKTGAINYQYLNYIGTREGVDLTPLGQKELEDLEEFLEYDDEIYLKYIHERPRSHGLWGNIDTADIGNLCTTMKDISTKTPVFRGIISLYETDANRLGYTNKRKWDMLLKNSLPEIGHTLGINYKDLEWIAAFHNEKGHPHVHYMLWSKAINYPINPYIHETKQHKCRELLSSKVFNEEFQFHKIEKTRLRDLLLDDMKIDIEKEISNLQNLNSNIKVSDTTLNDISSNLIDLLHSLPDKGKLNYQYLNSDLKVKVDSLIEKVLNNKELKKIYTKYINESIELAQIYSPTKAELDISIEKSKRDINKRLANIVLKALKTLINKEQLYSKLEEYSINTKAKSSAEYTTLDNLPKKKAILNDKIIANIKDNDELAIPLDDEKINARLYKDEKNTIDDILKNKKEEAFKENEVKPIVYTLFSDFFTAIATTSYENQFFKNYFDERQLDNKKAIIEESIKSRGHVRHDELER